MSYTGFQRQPEGSEVRTTRLLELPIIETPFTRLTEHWGTYQKGPCADYEMDYARCAGRVGLTKADTDCRKFFDDLHECLYRKKTYERYNMIQSERIKQKAGFKDPPPKDSVRTWFE